MMDDGRPLEPRRAEKDEETPPLVVKSKRKKKKKKEEKQENIKKITQDIRVVLERNKRRAIETREERRREHLAEKELVALTVSTEKEYRDQEARTKRRERAAEQQKHLLEDIKVKTQQAKQRMSERTAEREEREMERERRLKRAAEQRMRTLENIHMMDWSATEAMEEGRGLRNEVGRRLTLICASSAEGDRKRKRMKKLRWTEAARWKAKEHGQVRRMRRRAGRRLRSAEKDKYDEMDLDLDMMNLVGEEQEVSTLPDMIEDLSVMEDESNAWEVDAHDWLNRMTSKESSKVELSGCFSYDEERKEHADLDFMMSTMPFLQDQVMTGQERRTMILMPAEFNWTLCSDCDRWLLGTASLVVNIPPDIIEQILATKDIVLPGKWPNNINLMAKNYNTSYLSGMCSRPEQPSPERIQAPKDITILKGTNHDNESIIAAGSCSVPLSSEGEDRGMLKEQELADVQRTQDMQRDIEGLQDMPMEVQGVKDTTMNMQEMSASVQEVHGVQDNIMDVQGMSAGEDDEQGVSRQLMDKSVAGACADTVMEDMQGMKNALDVREVSMSRQPVEGRRSIASRIVELERKKESPGGSKRKPGRKRKEVLDLSNCQRIDAFMIAMGGRQTKRKANGEIVEQGNMKRMRSRGD